MSNLSSSGGLSRQLIAVYTEQCAIYRRLCRLTLKQISLLRHGETISLYMQLHDQKARLMQSIQDLENGLRPVLERYAALPAGAEPNGAELHATVQKLTARIQETLRLEGECRCLLERRLEKVQSDLEQTDLVRSLKRLVAENASGEARFVEVNT